MLSKACETLRRNHWGAYEEKKALEEKRDGYASSVIRLRQDKDRLKRELNDLSRPSLPDPSRPRRRTRPRRDGLEAHLDGAGGAVDAAEAVTGAQKRRRLERELEKVHTDIADAQRKLDEANRDITQKLGSIAEARRRWGENGCTGFI